MTLFHRRILTSFFAILFLIVTPLLVLYGSGYRINFSTKKIEHVGLLHVTTIPNNTTMVLNGQPNLVYKELVLKSVPPGEYDVIILKDGYHSWYKKLEIFPGQSTFIRNLLLFRMVQPQSEKTFTSPATVIAKHSDSIIFQLENKLTMFKFDTMGSNEIQLPNSSAIMFFYDSPDTNELIFKQDDQWFIANFTTLALKDITSILPLETKIVQTNKNNLLAFTEENVIQINIADNTTNEPTSFINQTLPQALLISNNTIWLIATEPSHQRSFLYEIRSLSSRPRLIVSLPFAQDYQIIEDYNGFLTIFDKSNTLYLVDTKPASPKLASFPGVHTWQWSKDHTQLLTATDFELRIIHLQNGEKQELLQRISTPIIDTAWHPEENHVFYVTDNKIRLIERDDRNTRNVFVLAENYPNTKIVNVDKNGKYLWFITTNENRETSFYKLSIAE